MEAIRGKNVAMLLAPTFKAQVNHETITSLDLRSFLSFQFSRINYIIQNVIYLNPLTTQKWKKHT